MPMGSTGTVNITPEMMTAALRAVEEYESVTSNLYTRLDNVVSGLIPGSFSGSAAQGFETFYTNNIEPATGQAVKDIIELLKNIINGINDAIPKDGDGLDDQLGSLNRSNNSGDGN